MRIQKSNQTIKYIRTIESMGEKTVLFNVKHIHNRSKVINHFCYYNKNSIYIENRLPLDLAICSIKMNIEYISFFYGKENVFNFKFKNNILYIDDSALITDERFTFDKRYIDVKMEFNQYIQNRDVFVISKEAKKNLIGYRLDDDHYILFDAEDNFSGVVFKNLTDKQMEELKKSNVI